MRRPVLRTSHVEAIALFDTLPTFDLASTTVNGAPILRTLHGVVIDGRLAFHASPVGEKMDILGRETVVAASRTIATIPSYFTDPDRACPATTLYVSAQAHGRVERIDDPLAKAVVLSRLMQTSPSHPTSKGGA